MNKLYTGLILTFLFYLPSNAKLKQVNFSYLIDSSQIIAIGNVIEFHALSTDNVARIAVNKSYRGGAYKLIRVRYSNEEHDYQLNNLNLKYLFFLRIEEKGWGFGTVYGRSFWPISTMKKNGKELEVIYLDWRFKTFLDFPPALIKRTNENVKYIILKDFIAYLKLEK